LVEKLFFALAGAFGLLFQEENILLDDLEEPDDRKLDREKLDREELKPLAETSVTRTGATDVTNIADATITVTDSVVVIFFNMCIS